MATDYAAVLAVTNKDAEWGTATTYADLERTWTDAAPIPSQATLDAAWPAVEAYIALIEDMPSKDELDDVVFGDIMGPAADAIKARRTAAKAARLRIP